MTNNYHETTQLTQQSNSREYDIILYGATSFVGQLTAAYLHRFLEANRSDDNTAGANSMGDVDSIETTKSNTNSGDKKPVKWAIAGRNLQKLEEVKAKIGDKALPIIIADSKDTSSLDAMATKTKVIISTVGPYLKYGEPLIKACVDNGTDYVDLTGESIFIKDMMDTYAEDAKRTGARIVNSCGFDSIPSDLGVLFTQNTAKKQIGEYCDTINMRVKAAKGGLSGGTIASMATIFTAVADDKSRRRQLLNPYLLNDDSQPPSIRQKHINKPKWDAQNDRWLAPFIMASINTAIVHRSNQLQGYKYGRNFKYDEAVWMPAGIKGKVMSYGVLVGMAGFAAGMAFKQSRKLLNDHVLPKAGTGPDKKERENGCFDVRFIGYTPNLKQIKTKVTGSKDPGYGATCEMLAQSALCLSQDIEKDSVAGGFWTPAAAMGDALIDRLQSHTVVDFSIVS